MDSGAHVSAAAEAELAGEGAREDRDRAPVPDFRYVGLEPIETPQGGVALAAVGLGAGLALVAGGLDAAHAVLGGALSAAATSLALRGMASARAATVGTGARMAVVPWGVLVERDETPRILRWAAVRRVEVVAAGARGLSSLVVVETAQERFEGEARGRAPLEQLALHLDAYALEQSTPLALGLGAANDLSVEPAEPFFEPLLAAVGAFLCGGEGARGLGLGSGTYRKPSLSAPTASAVEVLRQVLAARTQGRTDARAFAAVVAAELGAAQLREELVALTQSPHPFVAAVAKQAARRLGIPRARTGTLDEVAPFLWEADRGRLEAWAMARRAVL